MGVGGDKFVGAGAGVRCGGRVRIGVGGRKFVGAGAKVRCGGTVPQQKYGKTGKDGRTAVDKWCGLWVYQGQCGQEK